MADAALKVKKRKRNTDVSSKPSKRVAINEDKQVRISLQQEEEWAPVVASSRGLKLPESISLQPYTQKRKNIPAGHGRTPILTTELLLHSSAQEKLEYTAREGAADGPDSLLKHYVGVYDPQTGNIEVTEARRMVVRGTVRAHKAASEEFDPAAKMRDLRNDLGQTFGTKKSKKSIASFTENAINPGPSIANGGTSVKIDSASKAMLDNIVEATAGMSTKDELAEVIEANKPRPKPNTDATEVQQVYTVNSLIGESNMQIIPVKRWQDTLKANKAIQLQSRYVAHRVQNCAENVQKLKILRYMYFMFQLLDKSRDRRSEKTLPRNDDLKAAVEDMPSVVLEDFKRRFTNHGTLSKFQIDLVITHLCALACLVDNYDVEMWDLQEDLKLDTKGMSQYFQEIGAKITALGAAETRKMDKPAAAQRKIARLRLPLVFPAVRFRRAKR